MADLPITLTCADYTLVMPLATGDIKPEGIALTLIHGAGVSWEMRGNAAPRARRSRGPRSERRPWTPAFAGVTTSTWWPRIVFGQTLSRKHTIPVLRRSLDLELRDPPPVEVIDARDGVPRRAGRHREGAVPPPNPVAGKPSAAPNTGR
jgi:hypothetical protein